MALSALCLQGDPGSRHGFLPHRCLQVRHLATVYQHQREDTHLWERRCWLRSGIVPLHPKSKQNDTFRVCFAGKKNLETASVERRMTKSHSTFSLSEGYFSRANWCVGLNDVTFVTGIWKPEPNYTFWFDNEGIDERFYLSKEEPGFEYVAAVAKPIDTYKE